MYYMVRVSGGGENRLDKKSRAVIASGFLNAWEARASAARWVERHFPDATYEPESDQWLVSDEDGSTHLFSIESNFGEDAVVV